MTGKYIISRRSLRILLITIALGITTAQAVVDPCDKACIEIFAPVCGSDGVTYSNECFLEIAQCLDPSINKVWDEECPIPPCPIRDGTQVDSGNICSNTDDGRSSCPTQVCYFPIENGDDRFCCNPCSEGSPLPDTFCGGIAGFACPDPNLYECVILNTFPDSGGACCPFADPCDKACIEIFAPVCGSDGVTYSNECFLEIAQCRDPSINKVSDGECPIPACPFRDDVQVSSGDVCLDRADGRSSCPTEVCYSSIENGDDRFCCNPCSEGSPLPDTFCGGIAGFACPDPNLYECVILNTFPDSGGACCPIDSCSKPCTKILRPVCGSDGVSYDNQCLLEIAQCRDPSILLVFEGDCQNNPCEVGTPLPDVFCGRGPTRQNCPDGYECLISPTDRFAVCCPE